MILLVVSILLSLIIFFGIYLDLSAYQKAKNYAVTKMKNIICSLAGLLWLLIIMVASFARLEQIR